MRFHNRVTGAAVAVGIMSTVLSVHAPSAYAADKKAEPPDQEQRAIDNAAPTRVDAQIKELHDKLHITPAEENLWKDVAEAMRDTAKEVRTKLSEREEKEKAAPATAVGELRAYRDLQQVQYDGVKRLLDPVRAAVRRHVGRSRRRMPMRYLSVPVRKPKPAAGAWRATIWITIPTKRNPCCQ